MFSFLHAADIHLDSPLRGLEKYEGAPVDEIRSATRRALENLVDLALQRRVDFVLLAGDLYDGRWKDHNTGLFFVRQMTRLRQAGIPVVAIRGNHDAENKMTKALRLPENVHLLSHRKAETADCQRLQQLGVAVHGRSYSRPDHMENLADEYPPAQPGCFNIGLLHTSLSGAEGHEPYAPCTLDDLAARHYDYWALGHVHRRRVVAEDPPIVFPGNIQGRHIRETGAKGCMLVVVDDQGRCKLEFCPLDVLRWELCEVDVSGADAGEEVVRRIATELLQLRQAGDDLPLAIRIVVDGACAAHDDLVHDRSRWLNEIRSAAMDIGGGSIWVEQVIWRTAIESHVGEVLDGPLRELCSLVEEIRGDDEALHELRVVFDDLRRKLPDELRHDDSGVSLDDLESLAQLLDQVRPTILGQMTEHVET